MRLGEMNGTKKEPLRLLTRSPPPSDQFLSPPWCKAALRQPVAEWCQGAALKAWEPGVAPAHHPIPICQQSAQHLLLCCPSSRVPPHGYGTSSRITVHQWLLEEPGSHSGMGQPILTSSGVSWSTTGYPCSKISRLWLEKVTPCTAQKGWEMWLHPGARCSNVTPDRAGDEDQVFLFSLAWAPSKAGEDACEGSGRAERVSSGPEQREKSGLGREKPCTEETRSSFGICAVAGGAAGPVAPCTMTKITLFSKNLKAEIPYSKAEDPPVRTDG